MNEESARVETVQSNYFMDTDSELCEDCDFMEKRQQRDVINRRHRGLCVTSSSEPLFVE